MIYVYNENWIGGTYYTQNLVAALNHLPEEKRPELIVISNEEKHVEDLKKITGYRQLTYRKFDHRSGLLRRYLNKAGRKLAGKDIVPERHSDVDVVFPVLNHEHIAFFSNVRTPLFWIPDFQEVAMPDFFSAAELHARKDFQSCVLERNGHIVFSSQSAKADFNRLYPGNTVRQYLMPFAVSHPPDSRQDTDPVRKKYAITGDYFICSNQFWKHKNHGVVLKAIGELKASGTDVQVVFTGKEFDHRFPHYFEELKQLAGSLGITNNIRFLGFIDRADQVLLMKDAIAVIQPSLFEGWSTVVEDSKAMSATLIVSDIPVHREQLHHYDYKTFFSPHSEVELAACMRSLPGNKSGSRNPVTYRYEEDIKDFANSFVTILDELTHA